MNKGMMLFVRMMAQLIDWVISILILLLTFAYILPFLSQFIGNSGILGGLGLVIVVVLVFGAQYPFLISHQTIGKGFFGLEVVSTEKTRMAVTVSVMIQRELLCKLMSCYFICLPMLFGKAGGHEEATRTTVVKADKRVRRKRLG